MDDKEQKRKNSLANLRPAKKGEVRNPAGRPKGAKHLLARDFLEKLHKDFQEFGEEAIAEVREKDTSTYLRIIASLVPKEMTLNMGESAVDRLIANVPEERLAELAEGLAGLAGLVAADTGKGRQDIVEAEFSEVCDEIQSGVETSSPPRITDK